LASQNIQYKIQFVVKNLNFVPVNHLIVYDLTVTNQISSKYHA